MEVINVDFTPLITGANITLVITVLIILCVTL